MYCNAIKEIYEILEKFNGIWVTMNKLIIFASFLRLFWLSTQIREKNVRTIEYFEECTNMDTKCIAKKTSTPRIGIHCQLTA